MVRKFRRFCLADLKKEGMPRVDYHIHADYADGAASVEDIIKASIDRGLSEIAITEHVWRGADWIDEYVGRIRLADREGSYVLAGAEARAVNRSGDLNVNAADLEKFDLIIGCVHRYPSRHVPDSHDIRGLSAADAVEIEEQTLIAMLRRGQIDIVGHIGRALEKFFPDAVFPAQSARNVISEAKRAGIAVEVNARSKNARDILAECIRLDCPMSFGSDAHSLDGIGLYDRLKIQDIVN